MLDQAESTSLSRQQVLAWRFLLSGLFTDQLEGRMAEGGGQPQTTAL